MNRSLLLVLSLLALAALAALLLLGDPLGLGTSRRTPGSEGLEAEPAGAGGPRLASSGRPAAGQLPREVDGEPVGTLRLVLGTGVLRGQVTGAGTPLPLARVVLYLPPPHAPAALRTREEGRFEVQGLPAGACELSASAEGWRGRTQASPPLAEGQQADMPPIDLQAREALRDGIEVKVTDLAGRPLAGASVLATTIRWDLHLLMGPARAGEREVLSGTATSDGEGVARLVPLQPQAYSVVVRAPGMATQAWDRVVVARGRVERITARLAPGVSIAGRVVAADGTPVAGASVMGFHQPSFMGCPAVATAGDGSFLLEGLREGRYWLMCGSDEHGRGQANPVTSPSTGTTIRLGGVGWVEGRVLGGDGSPRAGVSLRPWGNEPFGYVYSQVHAVGADGRFRLPLTPGSWTLDAWDASGALAQGTKASVKVGEATQVEIRLPAGGVVQGTVTDAAGNHVEGAEVYVRMGGFPPGPNREQYARSDREGGFLLKGLPLEPLKLHVRHPRHADTTWEGTPAPAGSATHVTVRMGGGARITGRVLRGEGVPAAGEQVNLFQNWFEPRSTFCDEQGTYTFEPVAAGTWQLSTGVFENGAPGQVKTGIVVSGEGTLQVDFVARGGTGSLAGRITLSGRPAAGSLVRVLDARGEAGQQSATADAQGAWRIEGLQPGALRVIVQVPSGATVQRTVELDEETLAATLDLALGTSTVRGRVVRADGQPVTGAWVTLEAAGGEGDAMGRMRAQKTTATDGSFEAGGLEAGRYLLRVNSGEHAQHLGEPFVLAEGAAHDTGDIRLAPGVTLSGRVTDDTGKPVEDATVSLRDARGRSVFSFSMATTGSDGRYDVHGLEAGAYTVRFEARGLAPDERPVTLGAQGGSLDGVLSRGGTLQVLVEDDAGRPLAGARVSLLDARGQPVTRSLSLVTIFEGDRSVTDAGGRATLPDLAPGTYRASASKEGMPAGEAVPVSVLPGGSTSVRVVLAQPR
ncbi:MAG: carboxypeptidase regulatory-like domain-containing protein [Planctomycetia bacterium]